ncbi:hypothetical protein [Rhodococcus baikonurensis]|uniref:Uncharacterized protein n=1 Tax=Rhodococcus baikonurensis TaxID=172041 RepID=A0ABV5XU56_9NOCA
MSETVIDVPRKAIRGPRVVLCMKCDPAKGGIAADVRYVRQAIINEKTCDVFVCDEGHEHLLTTIRRCKLSEATYFNV